MQQIGWQRKWRNDNEAATGLRMSRASVKRMWARGGARMHHSRANVKAEAILPISGSTGLCHAGKMAKCGAEALAQCLAGNWAGKQLLRALRRQGPIADTERPSIESQGRLGHNCAAGRVRA